MSSSSALGSQGALSIESLDLAGWIDASRGFSDNNYRQSWAFARACAERVGAASEHIAILRDGELIAAADVRVRLLPLVRGGIAYVNGGPLVRSGDPSEAGNLRDALLALQAEYVDRRGLTLRVLPPIAGSAWNEELGRVYRELGFDQAEMAPYRTFRVDIRPDPAEIRKAFAQKWRNGLNGAEKQGLEIEVGDAPENLFRFAELFASFRERKSFDLDLGPDFYAEVQKAHHPDERFVVSLALLDGVPVGGHVASHIGDTAVYLLGATLEAGLKAKAGYLLQWRTILEAKQRGLAWYDLGGIDPEGNPGVYRFKKGLSGEDVETPGPFERVPSGATARLTRMGERVYRAMKARTQSGQG